MRGSGFQLAQDDEEGFRAWQTTVDTRTELAQWMATHVRDVDTALDAARQAGVDTAAYVYDPAWREPAQWAPLMQGLVQTAFEGGRMLELVRVLSTFYPDEAPGLMALHDGLQAAQEYLARLPQQARPQQQQQQQQQQPAARPPSATRGDDQSQQATSGDHFESLRLDTAVPERVYVQQAFALAVAVRQMTSPALMRAGLPVTGSGGVDVFWPADAAFVTLRIRISAPDCTIHGSKGDTFRLLPGRDSPDFLYHLTPKRTGPISIFVTVYQDEERLGTAGVDTTAGEVTATQPAAAQPMRSAAPETATPAGALTMQLQSHVLLSLPVARALRGLQEVLAEYFRDRAVPLVIAGQAGLDSAYIRLSDIVADLWWNVLEAAHAEQRVAELVEVAKGRVNRRAGALDAAYAAYASAL